MKTLTLILLLLLCPLNVWGGFTNDGNDDIVNCGSAADLDNFWDDGGTVSMWVKFNSLVSSGDMFEKLDGVNDYSWVSLSNGSVRFYQAATTTFFICTTATGVITTGTWHHLAITWDGSVDSSCSGVIFYKDGSPVSWITTAGTGTRPDDSSAVLHITEGDSPTTAQYSNMSIFDSVLSASSIAVLASDETTIAPYNQSATLLRFWRMDDLADGISAGDGTIIKDMTGNGDCTADDGGDDLGATFKAEEVLSYPDPF